MPPKVTTLIIVFLKRVTVIGYRLPSQLTISGKPNIAMHEGQGIPEIGYSLDPLQHQTSFLLSKANPLESKTTFILSVHNLRFAELNCESSRPSIRDYLPPAQVGSMFDMSVHLFLHCLLLLWPAASLPPLAHESPLHLAVACIIALCTRYNALDSISHKTNLFYDSHSTNYANTQRFQVKLSLQ